MTHLEGELQSIALPLVLESIAAIRSSGILTVQGQDDIVAVSFVNGDIVSADALNQTVEDGLGKALQENRVISAEDFDAVAREHSSGSSGSLGDTLVKRGLIDRDDLLWGLRQQTCRLMIEVLGWRQGEFKFYGGDEVSYEDGFQPLTVDELLMRSLEEPGASPDSTAGLPDLDAVYRKTSPREPVRILGRDGDGQGPGIWLRQDQADFLTALDGETAASAVADAHGLAEHPRRFTVFKLRREGLIEAVVGRAGGTAPVARDAVEHPPRSTAAPELSTQAAAAATLPAAPIAEEARAPEPPSIAATAASEASLRAEIFTPPEPDSLEELEFTGGRASPPISRAAERWLGPALALVLVAALVWGLVSGPGSTGLDTSLLPFPWQEDQRRAFERQVRQSLFLKIDRAAKIYFLVQAHYPDSLSDLVELGLLSPADLDDPAGYPLGYSTDEVGYRIEVRLPDGGGEDLGTTESITGDFLLDPQWSQLAASTRSPLVLLD